MPRHAEDSTRFNICVSTRKAKATSRIPSSHTSSHLTTIVRQRGNTLAVAVLAPAGDSDTVDNTPTDNPLSTRRDRRQRKDMSFVQNHSGEIASTPSKACPLDQCQNLTWDGTGPRRPHPLRPRYWPARGGPVYELP
ncbi:hypothetical protein BC628DRAFT_1374340 [Trametes gibbosa]|nr:hypothetical protein BC628DRAFT_1374340 [Trametes gibbosa]